MDLCILSKTKLLGTSCMQGMLSRKFLSQKFLSQKNRSIFDTKIDPATSVTIQQKTSSPSTCRLLTQVGLGVSPGCFRAESRTVLSSQAPRVEASLGVYYSGFIQTNKQKNKQRNEEEEDAVCGGCSNARSAKMHGRGSS